LSLYYTIIDGTLLNSFIRGCGRWPAGLKVRLGSMVLSATSQLQRRLSSDKQSPSPSPPPLVTDPHPHPLPSPATVQQVNETTSSATGCGRVTLNSPPPPQPAPPLVVTKQEHSVSGDTDEKSCEKSAKKSSPPATQQQVRSRPLFSKIRLVGSRIGSQLYPNLQLL
jgi:hypothetical protein